MKHNVAKKLNLKKETISQLTMKSAKGGLTLTWGCSEEGGWTCHTCDFECNTMGDDQLDRA